MLQLAECQEFFSFCFGISSVLHFVAPLCELGALEQTPTRTPSVARNDEMPSLDAVA